MQEAISRKDFLKGAFRFFKEEMSAKEDKNSLRGDKFIYPPGIESLNRYLDKCKQSYNCISVCPHEALMVYRDDENDSKFGYPVIDPRKSACYLCDNYPCIKACDSGALNPDFKNRKLGLAIIDETRCFAYNGTFCQACIFNCPLSGEAIYADRNNRPIVNEALCSGCGICTQSCPMEEAAIEIIANSN